VPVTQGVLAAMEAMPRLRLRGRASPQAPKRLLEMEDLAFPVRQQAAKMVKKETRKQPQAEEELELSPDVRVVTPSGGTIVFSAAQLHTTVPNTTNRTRFSIDFRTVNLDDLLEGVGAPNIDSECTGTTLRDFLRASDLAPLPEEVISAYDRRPATAPAA